jgi:hypothetical protein
MPNDECQMPNDEAMTNDEGMTNDKPVELNGCGVMGMPQRRFVIRHSGFLRHLAFVIRH